MGLRDENTLAPTIFILPTTAVSLGADMTFIPVLGLRRLRWALRAVKK